MPVLLTVDLLPKMYFRRAELGLSAECLGHQRNVDLPTANELRPNNNSYFMSRVSKASIPYSPTQHINVNSLNRCSLLYQSPKYLPHHNIFPLLRACFLFWLTLILESISFFIPLMHLLRSTWRMNFERFFFFILWIHCNIIFLEHKLYLGDSRLLQRHLKYLVTFHFLIGKS